MLLAALADGLYLVTVDANPRFDDMGILAGVIAISAGVLSAIRPRAALIVGLLVGVPVPVVEVIRFDNWGAAVALGFALAGAFAGAYLGIIVRRTTQPST